MCVCVMTHSYLRRDMQEATVMMCDTHMLKLLNEDILSHTDNKTHSHLSSSTFRAGVVKVGRCIALTHSHAHTHTYSHSHSLALMLRARALSLLLSPILLDLFHWRREGRQAHSPTHTHAHTHTHSHSHSRSLALSFSLSFSLSLSLAPSYPLRLFALAS